MISERFRMTTLDIRPAHLACGHTPKGAQFCAKRANPLARRAVKRRVGEILKFIGDGLLAAFPLNRPTACADALAAVLSVRRGMAALNERRIGANLEPLGYGLGVNVGDVMYGNIGTPKRLDFTVIGPAVNTAARLEGLTKSLGRTALFSSTFADIVGSPSLRSLGRHPLRGLGEPLEVFGFADENFQD